MNSFESIRFIIIALIATTSGIAMVWNILKSISMLPQRQMEQIVLFTSDETLSKKIEELSKAPRNLRKNPAADALEIIDSELEQSGMSLNQWLGGGEWNTEQYLTSEEVDGRRSRRLSTVEQSAQWSNNVDHHDTHDEGSVSTLSKVLPPLVLAVAGLVIICALTVCLFDARGRSRDDEENKKEEESCDERLDTSLSTSSLAQSSYIRAIIAATNPVLPPVDCVFDDDLLEDDHPLSPLSSITGNIVVENKHHSTNEHHCENSRKKEDHVSESSQFPTNADITNGENDEHVGITHSESQSADRSDISSLTEVSETQDSAESNSEGSLIEDLRVESSVTLNNPIDSAPSMIGIDRLKNEEPCMSENVSKQNTGKRVEVRVRDKDSTISRIDFGAEHHPMDSTTPKSVSVQSTDSKHAKTHTSREAGKHGDHEISEKSFFIRDIILVGSKTCDNLGLEIRSHTTGDHPIITNVSTSSPLIGSVFEGDVILEMTDSQEPNNDKNESHNNTSPADQDSKLIEAVENTKSSLTTPCVQMTVMSSHDDYISHTDSSTEILSDQFENSTGEV